MLDRIARCAPLLFALFALPSAGCREPQALAAEATVASTVGAAAPTDPERLTCRGAIAAALAEPDLGGAPAFDRQRAGILGRVRGEPLVWVRTPAAAAEPRGSEGIAQLRARYRHDPAALRARVLREGYLYADEPSEALSLVKQLTLADLFAEPEIWLQRGERSERLVRAIGRHPQTGLRTAVYHHTEGAAAGYEAALLLGDRVSVTRDALAQPLHRDVRALRNREGFERARIVHRTDSTMVAELRYPLGGADRWIEALLRNDGAHIEIDCLDAAREERASIAAFREADAPRRRAVAALGEAVDTMVREALPFDRPRNVKDHFSDGQLRPQWRWAYQRGAVAFQHDGEGYLVFDERGRPAPPQMCVEFILDSYERASGTWYEPRGAELARTEGGLDFDDFGIQNRAGVLGFEIFASKHPDLFEVKRFGERVPFAERERFFASVLAEADGLAPGDVISIQGPKPDGYVHQHAILIADTDPLTGFPHALADQMRRPRIRTFEGIMAEAPKRALLYHVRPRAELLLRLDPARSAVSGQRSAKR